MLTFLMSSLSAMKLNLFIGESDAKLAFQNGDRCRSRAAFANDLFKALSSFEVLRTWQAMGDDG